MSDEVPEGWVATTVGELFDFKYGKGLPEAQRQAKGVVKVYGSNGVVGAHDRALTKGPTIIVGRKGSVGAVHFSAEPCWPIDTTYFIDEFRAAFQPRYWALYFTSLGLGKQEKSSAVPGISRDDVYSTDVLFPPVAEQSRIVDKLDRLLTEVEAGRQRLAKVPMLLQRFRQSLFAAGCSGRLTTDWRARNPGIGSALEMLQRHALRTADRDRNVRRTKPASGLTLLDYSGEFPASWTWVKVRELVEMGGIVDVQDGNHGELYPRAADFGQVGVPYISAEHVVNDAVDLGSAPRLNRHKAGQLRIGFAKANDVLLTHNATVGRVAVLPLGSPSVVLSTSTTYYRVDEAVLLAQYVATFFRSHYFQSQLQALMEQTTRNQVSVTKQVELGIAVPPVSEQRELVRRVNEMLALVAQTEENLAKIEEQVGKLKPSLLAKAFNGELVPTEARLAREEGRDYEPASVLLGRLRQQREGAAERLTRSARRTSRPGRRARMS